MPKDLPTPTPEQRKAIEHLGSPLRVLAGPGTGKTTVLALRVLFLLKKIVSPNQVLAVTFTTKAAGEMRDRLKDYGLSEDEHPWIATLHAVAARILHENANVIGLPNNFLIADSGECRLALDDACLKTSKELKLSINDVRKAMPDLRRAWCKGLTVSQVTGEPISSLYKHYHALMLFYHATDFDGLLIHALSILSKNAEVLNHYQAMAKFLLIDEYQDINEAQHQLLKLLADDPNGVFAVGDDDQSIYSWRGGSPGLILGFDKSFSKASSTTLTICQRCPGYILRGALSVIERNKNRLKKDLKPLGPDGEKIRLLASKSENGEARWIADWIKTQVDRKTYMPSDITVLATDPTIAELAFIEVLKRGVKAVRKSGSPLNSKPVRTIMALIRLSLDATDNLAARRSLEEGPIQGIGLKAVEAILLAAERTSSTLWEVLLSAKENGLSRWEKPIAEFVRYILGMREMDMQEEVAKIVKLSAEALGQTEDGNIEWLLKQAESVTKESGLSEFIVRLRSQVSLDVTEEAPTDADEDAVCFLTTYLVKGLESKVVFVIGLEEGLFPDPSKDVEEQRRLFYVAMTRAKSELFLCTSKMRKVRGFQFYSPSPFISEIPKAYTVEIENT